MTLRSAAGSVLQLSLVAALLGAGCGEKRRSGAQVVRGRVTNEEGTPLAGVKWCINATEEFQDGEWVLVMRSGALRKNSTDEHGCFLLAFHEQIRYDLQFEKPGFAPAFLFQISAEASHIDVVMRRGEEIRGTVVRLIDGRREPVSGTMVELRFPTRDYWYQVRAFTDTSGKFGFRACPPPAVPVGCADKTCRPAARRWQLVYAGQVVELDVRDGEPVEAIDFEVEVRATRERSSAQLVEPAD